LVKKFGVRVISYHRPVKNAASNGFSGCGAIGGGAPPVAQDARPNNTAPSKIRFTCNLLKYLAQMAWLAASATFFWHSPKHPLRLCR
jgi:hypothetical protein